MGQRNKPRAIHRDGIKASNLPNGELDLASIDTAQLENLNKKADELRKKIFLLFDNIVGLLAMIDNVLPSVSHNPQQQAGSNAYSDALDIFRGDKLVVTLTVGDNSTLVPVESVDKAYVFLSNTKASKFDTFFRSVYNDLLKGNQPSPYAAKYVASVYVSLAKTQPSEKEFPHNNIRNIFTTTVDRPFGIMTISVEPVLHRAISS